MEPVPLYYEGFVKYSGEAYDLGVGDYTNFDTWYKTIPIPTNSFLTNPEDFFNLYEVRITSKFHYSNYSPNVIVFDELDNDGKYTCFGYGVDDSSLEGYGASEPAICTISIRFKADPHADWFDIVETKKYVVYKIGFNVEFANHGTSVTASISEACKRVQMQIENTHRKLSNYVEHDSQIQDCSTVFSYDLEEFDTSVTTLNNLDFYVDRVYSPYVTTNSFSGLIWSGNLLYTDTYRANNGNLIDVPKIYKGRANSNVAYRTRAFDDANRMKSISVDGQMKDAYFFNSASLSSILGEPTEGIIVYHDFTDPWIEPIY